MKNISTYITLLISTIIIFLLNWWTAPTMSDDLLYHFVWQQEWNQPLQKIESLGDVIHSQIVHYATTNGRSVVHTIAQFMMNLVSEPVVKVINTMVFLYLLWITGLYTARKKENLPLMVLLTFSALFLIIKGFFTGFVWFLGACNYLWTLALNMTFLYFIKKYRERKADKTLAWLLPLAFISGWTHEAIALPLSLMFLLYMMTNRNDLWNKATTYCMMTYMAGMLMILISPALWQRANIGGITLMQRIISGGVNIVLGLRLSWLLIATLLVIFFKNKPLLKDILNKQKYLLLAWLMAVSIVFLCGTSIERVTICADFLALIILLDIVQSNRCLRYQASITTFLCMVSLFVAVLAISANKENYDNYCYHVEQLNNQDTNIIKARQLPEERPSWLKALTGRYMFPTIEFSFYNCYMAFDQNDINSRALAFLYQKPSIISLPEDVVNKIETDSTAYREIAEDEHHRLYIQQVDDSVSIQHVVFRLGPEVPLKPWQRLLSYKGDEYELDAFNYETVSIADRSFIVMTIPTTNIRRRIKEVVYPNSY